MIGLISALSSILAIHPPATANAFQSIHFDEACKKAAEQKRIVLIDFYTTWCGPCKRLDRVTWADGDVRKWLAANTVALKLDAEKETKLSERYGVDGYPTILLLRPDGTEIDRLVGYREPEALLAEVKWALAGMTSAVRAQSKLTGDKKYNLMARFFLAEALARNGYRREALEEYLACYDNDLEDPADSENGRSSVVVHAIMRLGESYPPALVELRKRRDQAEESALKAATKDRRASKGRLPGTMAESALDFAALNQALGEDERTLNLYDRLLKEPGAEPTLHALLRFVIDALLEAKRYEDILAATEDPLADVCERIRQFEQESASAVGRSSEVLIPRQRKRVVSELAKYYEALLGARKPKKAAEVAEQLITFEPSAGTFVALIERAKRAGDDAAVRELVQKAEKTVDGEDRGDVRRAAGGPVE